MLQDLRHSARMLLKNPGFTLIAVLSIAIGVGANAAMFSVADGLVIRPLPVPRAGEVMTVSGVLPAGGRSRRAAATRNCRTPSTSTSANTSDGTPI